MEFDAFTIFYIYVVLGFAWLLHNKQRNYNMIRIIVEAQLWGRRASVEDMDEEFDKYDRGFITKFADKFFILVTVPVLLTWAIFLYLRGRP